METKVVILGTLGELVKKICELELLEEENHSRDSIVSMVAYYKILEQWPVQDKAKTELLCKLLKVQCEKHLSLEKQLHNACQAGKQLRIVDDILLATQTASEMIRFTNMYLDSLKKLRVLLLQLTEQGSQIDVAPFSFNIEEGSNESS